MSDAIQLGAGKLDLSNMDGEVVSLADLNVELQTERDSEIFRIKGRGFQFNKPIDLGYYTLEFAPGSFDDVLDDVVLLVNHDDSRLALARSPNTMQFSPTDDALNFTAELAMVNPDSQIVASAVNRGDVYKMSVSFVTNYNDGDYVEHITYDDDPERKDKLRVLKVIRFREISFVNYPATDTSHVEPLSEPEVESENIDVSFSHKIRLQVLKLQNSLLEIE